MIPGLELPPQYGYPLLTALILAFVGYIIQRVLKNRPGPPSIPEMWARIEKLEAKAEASGTRESAALKETTELKEFISDWITRLLHWDNTGRKGRMPLPSDDDLTRLNIKHPDPQPEGEQP